MRTTPPSAGSPQIALETAIMTTCGLIELLTEELIRRRERDGDEHAGECAAGIFNLSQSTMDELRACHEAAFEEHRQLGQKNRTQHGKA